ncbi:MAG: anthranilate phosphoribosyltransferase [Planifilum fulgidum]
MIRECLSKLVQGEDLTREEARQLMIRMMEGELSPSQMAGVLTALRIKGETVEELTGLAEGMRSKATSVFLRVPGAVDTCGTGGDGGRTFNISTGAAIVAAAAGIPVAKHGNRAVSGRSGSADVLEALGIRIQMSPKEAEKALDRLGICFMFAPLFHPAMKQVMPTRKELGFRTCFNLLGPLVNPAGVKRQLMGVFDPSLTETAARVLETLGAERVLVVAGLDGIDEISVCAPTRISEVRGGKVETYTVTPEELGVGPAAPEAVSGGDARTNARILREVFRGEKGPCRDVILVNAGAVLYVAGRTKSIAEGVRAAADVVDSGRAEKKLEEMIRYSREVSHVS